MSKKQLIEALVKLGVAPDVFKDLDVPQLQALLTQKQIEKAQLDAENKNSQGAGDGTGDGGSDEGGDDGDDEGDGEGGSESGSAGGGAGTGDGAGAPAGALSSSAQASAFDGDIDGYDRLTKLRSRGFSCISLGMVVSQGTTYSTGKEFVSKEGDELWADEKTRDHLLVYRVAEKA